MLFSPVVAEGIGDGALGFLRANGNLFNVAITRARGQLHVVGDLAFAAHSGVQYLEQFAAYAADLQGHHRQAEGRAVDPAELGPDYPAVRHPERVNLEVEPMFYRALFAAGLRPIPQYSVEQYDLDFALVDGDRRLDLEVDGRQHRLWTGEQCLRDRIRDMRLIELGWEVKRFLNIEVQDHLQQCVEWVVRWAKPPQQFG
jgi:very-short-patch-repair endonuclease